MRIPERLNQLGSEALYHLQVKPEEEQSTLWYDGVFTVSLARHLGSLVSGGMLSGIPDDHREMLSLFAGFEIDGDFNTQLEFKAACRTGGLKPVVSGVAGAAFEDDILPDGGFGTLYFAEIASLPKEHCPLYACLQKIVPSGTPTAIQCLIYDSYDNAIREQRLTSKMNIRGVTGRCRNVSGVYEIYDNNMTPGQVQMSSFKYAGKFPDPVNVYDPYHIWVNWDGGRKHPKGNKPVIDPILGQVTETGTI
jgi:hypothetical protein